jgi:hypothetical protein
MRFQEEDGKDLKLVTRRVNGSSNCIGGSMKDL